MTISRAIRGLNYQSEANSWWHRCNAVPRGQDGFEVNFDEFFAHTIATQPQGARYSRLKTALTQRLTDLKVYKVHAFGRYNLMVYVVGRNRNGSMDGVMTLAVET